MSHSTSAKVASALFAAALIAGAASPAQAGSTKSGQKGPYVSVDVGQMTVDIDDISGIAIDDTDLGVAVGVGYSFNEYVALELGYMYMGEASASGTGSLSGTYNGSAFSSTGTFNATAEGQALYLGPELSLPLMDNKLNLRLRGGVLQWRVDADISATGSLTYGGTTYAGSATASDSKDGTNFYAGGGASYSVTDNIDVRADYTHLNDVWDRNVSFISAGLVYNF